MGLFDKIIGPKYNEFAPYETRKMAVEKINNKPILADIAKNDSSDAIGEIAVEKINDVHVLADVVKNAKKTNQNTRKKAIEKINDDLVLRDIVFSLDERCNLARTTHTKGLHIEIADMAIKKITDESILIEVEKNTKNFKCNAIKDINDITILTDVIKNKPSVLSCPSVLEKITDESILIDLVKNDLGILTIDNVMEKINDETILKDFVKRFDEYVYGHSISNALDKINDESILIDIAKDKSLRDVTRVAAIWKITNRNVLLDLTKDSTNYVMYNRDGEYSSNEFKGTEVTHYPIKDAAKERLEQLGKTCPNCN